MKRHILTLFLALCPLVIPTSAARVTSDVDVIPMPREVNVRGSACRISSIKGISAPENLVQDAQTMASSLKSLDGIERRVNKGRCRAILSINEALKSEEYVLTVRRHKLVIEGGSADGVFYGIQTVLQEVTAYDGKVKVGVIKDAPRYEWRGYMLDESRHFFGVQQVKQILDVMAYYKLNKFHWHLTDAPGWRIEIKAYPLLTEVGSKSNYSNPEAPAAYYTQDQIKDIVAYAAIRHIEIVPEIDMPGHETAANRAYPENGVGDGESFTLNPGKECVYEFYTNVLKEVTELFPSRYLHLGADEVAIGSRTWSSDPYIKALMKREGMTEITEAEAYFDKKMTEVAHGLGRRVLTWDDVLDIGVERSGDDLITWWRHERRDHLYEGLKQGYGLILCPRLPLYYDFVQSHDHKVGRVWKPGEQNGIVPIEDVYAFPESLFETWEDDAADMNLVKGIQANLWSEQVATLDRVEFMTYPRICALAESAWTVAENKDWDSFEERLELAYEMFDGMDICYYDYRDPSHHPEVLR